MNSSASATRTASSSNFVPGAIGDSLTSFGGDLFDPANDQTNLLAFITAGAAGSYGTVSEPGTDAQKFPDGVIRYGEAESAFDKPYAEALGMPVDRIEWVDFLKAKPKRAASRARDEDDETPEAEEASESDRTVEYMFEDVTRTIGRLKGRPCLYIVDSLDALSDRSELERKDGEATMGMQKAKKLHELFRRKVGDIEKARMCVLIISQIKDKIGVTFGETKMRTGGHAMDFYASHCLWLAHIGRIKKTVGGIERVIGIEIKAQCKKNKVGLPFRECTFNLLFGYGIDDLSANVEWLLDHGLAGRLAEVDMTKSGYKTRIQALRNRGGQEVKEVRAKLNAIVVDEWARIENTFLPQAGKY